MQTVYILWLRELKRYSRSRSRMIGSLGQPLLFLFALGFGLGPVFQRAGQGNYFQFLAPGVIAMSILFTAIFAGIQVIWDKQFGFLKETLLLLFQDGILCLEKHLVVRQLQFCKGQ